MTETTQSLSQNRLLCQIRKSYVFQSPEERVRQHTLSLLFELGYPASLIAVEKKLSELPHLGPENAKLPNRRLDILCYSPRTGQPLLLIECKRGRISPRSVRQLLGYNLFVQAQYVALASSLEVQFLTACEPEGSILPHFPLYESLIT